MIAEQKDIKKQDEKKLIHDKLLTKLAATKQVLKESENILAIDEALLAYQRLKKVDPAIITATEKKAGEAKEAVDKSKKEVKKVKS